uniref:glycosyltransferase n=1 Tax=Olsenella timonensis TaxID=1805478 RepID=UPI00094EED30|nr:glycosyltransferase [Olsenella timonensis]
MCAPSYAVLMSCYAKDRPEWLSLALESMAAQTLRPTEVVLVFDGPLTEGLVAAVDAFDAAHPGLLVRVPLERNVGLGPALNAGLARCSCDVVARMDADDFSRPARLERQLAKLAEGYDMVGCNATEFSGDVDSPNSERVMPETHDEIVRFAKRRAPFVHPAFVVRRSSLEAVGGYRSVPYAEDFDLFIRLLRAGSRGYNLQEPLVAVRVDDDVYRRRGGLGYARDMLSFNALELREGWFSPAEFLVRSAANVGVALIPNGARDLVYKRLLRRSS